MNSSFALVLHGLQDGLLHSASPLVPASGRDEWRREWQSELWHVRQACTPMACASWQVEREVTAFCMGAFQDALCLRQLAWRNSQARISLEGSATKCLLGLAAALALSYALAVLLPGVRLESHPSWYQVRSGTILIQDARYNDDAAATIPFDQYRFWSGRRQRYFDGFAFYQMNEDTVSVGNEVKTGLKVAHASSNLFRLLGLTAPLAGRIDESGANQPGAVLSESIWRREFGADPGIVGSRVKVGNRLTKIAGIEPDGVWRLPGDPDVWLLEPDSEIASGGSGYLVAHLTALGRAQMWTQRVHITAYNADDAEQDLWGVSFEERTRGPWGIYQFTVLLAFLALPAITSVSLGEYSASSRRLSWPKRLRRWGFLAAKIALLLPIVYYASLDLAFPFTMRYSVPAQYVQLISSFLICLLGLRWVVLDQRQRCPVCLRRVAHPAQVGVASRTFLAWNGTELMCTGGHTLLHVPSLPTSWFSTQRWLYLDSSWEFLFAESGMG